MGYVILMNKHSCWWLRHQPMPEESATCVFLSEFD